MQDMLSNNVPAVWVQHYPFLNFSQFDYKWRPNYINIVRDPIEKVIFISSIENSELTI